MLKFTVLIACLIGAAFAAPAPCTAHAKLQNSSPSDAAQLAEAPKTLTLTFNEAASLASLKLINAGKEILIPLDKTAKPTRSYSLPLPSLRPGTYTVHWSAVAADDGHVTKGSFAFTVVG